MMENTDSGRCLTARATHAAHRARILGLGLSVGIAIALGACSREEAAEDYGLSTTAAHARFSMDGKERCFERNKLAPCSPYWDYSVETQRVAYRAANSDCFHLSPNRFPHLMSISSIPKVAGCPDGYSTDVDHFEWSGWGCTGASCSEVSNKPEKNYHLVTNATYSLKVCIRDRRESCRSNWR